MNQPIVTTIAKRLFMSAAFLFTLSHITACGGGGSGGYASNQDDKRPPVAIASALTIENISTPTTKRYQARANSQIVLTGKDSYSDYAPILTYNWTQLSGQTVTLVERTSNAVAFDAPALGDTAELRFQLSITDANGNTDTDEIEIDIQAVNDANRFLSHPNTPKSKLTLLAALSGGENTGPSEQSFSVEVITRAHWLNRLGVMDNIVVDSQELRSKFPENFNPATNYDPLVEERNPRLDIDLVLLNIDDINKHFETEQRDRRLDIHQIGTAYLTIEMVLQGTPAVNFELFALNADGDIIDLASIQPAMLAQAHMTATSTSVNTATVARKHQRIQNTVVSSAQGLFSTTLHMDRLLAELGLENAISANNYYALLDPSGQFSSFSQWSTYAGFTDADGKAIDDPNITHALYLNNYDLGFGRDMWLRKDGMGNVYSYVTNYPTVEAGLDGRQDFAIVAMEYSDNPDINGANAKIVKFYAFVPDERTGDYIRSASMNFDGRGEKFLPGVCTACHQSYQEGSQFTDVAQADLDATFMPWDLDSLLFASAENPALVESTLDASKFTADTLKKYSRESQEDALRNLNLGALATYKDNPVRHAAAIQLIHGWYGDETQELAVDQLPDNNFNGNYIQPGWEAEPELYHQSFARNCRICHVQLEDADTNFDDYDEFINNDNLITYVFEQGVMPMARLTMDRFWGGNASGADALRNHLEGLGKTTPSAPGAPVARFTASEINPTIEDTVELVAGTSLFPQTYAWSLTAPANSLAALSSTTGTTTSFSPDLPGESYALVLTVSNEYGVEAQDTQVISSADRAPIAPCLSADSSALTESGALNGIAVVSQLTVNQLGDGNVTLANTLNGSLGSVTIDPDLARLNYQLNNPFVRGVDLISYSLIDVNASPSTTDVGCSSSPQAGYGHIRIDTTNSGTLAPSGLTAAPNLASNTYTIDLDWDAPTDITPTGYRIYRDGIAIANTTNTSYSDSPLVHDTDFSYSVSTVFNTFESNPSTVANTRTVALTPLNLTGDNSVFGQISLVWDAPTGASNPISYSIYRENNGVKTTLANAISNTGPYVDSTVVAGIAYDYTATATDASGQESNASNTVSNTAKPLPPSSASATAISGTQINLSWNAVTNASAYKIYRKLSNQSDANYVQIAAPSTNSFSVTTGLSAGNNYNFRIGATVNGEDSITFAATSATTFPNAPAGLTVAPNTGGNRFTETRLTWTAASGNNISGYNVYRTGTGLIASNVANTFYVDSGRFSGTLYSYTVQAIAGGNTSAASGAASGATYPLAPTPTAENIAAASDASAHDTLRVSWPQVSGDSVTYQLSASGTRILGGAATTPTPLSFADASSTVQRDLTGLSSYSNYTITATATANGLSSSNTTSLATGVSYNNDILPGPAARLSCANAGCHSGDSAAALRSRFTVSCIQTNNLPSCNAAMTGLSLNANEAPLVQTWFANQYD
ncbi:hypothetical protein R50072_23390 [Simiduia litorea]|uniref:fibronectin type III domain-containing protein n=1 Tax=Simiduia litorea TaxID=1435348 RepID=UPI0036F25F40